MISRSRTPLAEHRRRLLTSLPGRYVWRGYRHGTVSSMRPPGLLELFDRVYVINLPERTDRRQEVEAELRRPLVGSASGSAGSSVTFFDARWPAEAAPFESTGLKGNFISHLSILRAAQADQLESVLILEDDAEFEKHLAEALPVIEAGLSELEWGVVQLGYTLSSGDLPAVAAPTLVPFRGEARGLHCYAVHRRALAPLVAHLERQLAGRPGDDLYGPMAVDGSINTFAWVNDDVARHVLVPSVCRQRSSRSSIDPSFLDRVIVLRGILGLARRLRRKVLGRGLVEASGEPGRVRVAPAEPRAGRLGSCRQAPSLSACGTA